MNCCAIWALQVFRGVRFEERRVRRAGQERHVQRRLRAAPLPRALRGDVLHDAAGSGRRGRGPGLRRLRRRARRPRGGRGHVPGVRGLRRGAGQFGERVHTRESASEAS